MIDMTGKTWTDRVCSDDLVQRYVLSNIFKVISVRLLRGYEHVAQRERTDELEMVFAVEMKSRRPRERPKKTRKNCVEQD